MLRNFCRIRCFFAFLLLWGFAVVYPVDRLLAIGIEKSTEPSYEGGVSAAKILDRMEETTAGIRDLQAQMTLKVFIKRLGFPFTLHADYYFKAPDKVKVALHGLPGLLLGNAPQTISAATTLTGFRKDYQKLYHADLLGIRKINDQDAYSLALTPISADGDVARTLLWVDRRNYTVLKLLTYYKDGSWVMLEQTYVPRENYFLIQHTVASMNFVKSNLEANVDADYSNHKVNQNLSDAIFETEKK